MKKVCAILLVLGFCNVSNAAMNISVVDSYLNEGQTTSVNISGDGFTAPGVFYLGVYGDGPGALSDLDAVIVYPGNASAIWLEGGDIPLILGCKDFCVVIQLNDVPPVGWPQPPLSGELVNGITFTTDGIGQSTLGLFDGDGALIDYAVITTVPEPTSIIILALGGLLLRRRK